MQAIHFRAPHRPRRRLLALVATAAAVLAMTAACSDDDPSSEPTPVGAGRISPVPSNASYGAADVVFAQDILANHQRAMELIKLAKERATRPEVKALAVQAEKNRQAALILVPMWLEKFKQPSAPALPPDQAGGIGASANDVAALRAAQGAAFDKLFLELIIKIDEATDILSNGQQWSGIDGRLMSLAHKVQDDEKVELPKARQLLGG